ncbi:hypothetical protein MKW98_006419 [Papaver atlanticum]|uniref:Peptidase A1 domain-containing protein n=1 Tax=Papaver atlanticum TaxID=357466 RepID=A0AAD4X3Y8_9MAGN|nr:hypothetical protein MKW98_006419 [Papaver atlanticum]
MGIGNTNSLLIISIVIVIFLLSQTRNVHGGVCKVTHRFGDEAVENPKNHNHNHIHHGRLLAADEIPFNGRGAINSGLYCVQISSGSPLLHDSPWLESCCNPHPCPKTSNYIITYILHYISFDDLLSENTTTIAATSRATFGYGLEQTAVSSPYDLVVSGNVTKKKFSHCLDGRNGIGIVVVGDVVQPNLKTTPLFSNQSHYYVIMKSIEVGKDVLDFSNVVFPVGVSDEVIPVQDGKRTMMDSGTAMSYFPEGIFKKLYKMVMSSQLSSGLKTRVVQENYTCFSFNQSVDDYFPAITFTFENATELKAYPHEYLFQLENNWCVGFRDNASVAPDRKDVIVLGDLILSNRMLLYDLENHSLGLAEQNCSSAIIMTDEQTGDAYLANAKPHLTPSTSSSVNLERVTRLLLLAAFLCLYTLLTN